MTVPFHEKLDSPDQAGENATTSHALRTAFNVNLHSNFNSQIKNVLCTVYGFDVQQFTFQVLFCTQTLLFVLLQIIFCGLAACHINFNCLSLIVNTPLRKPLHPLSKPTFCTDTNKPRYSYSLDSIFQTV